MYLGCPPAARTTKGVIRRFDRQILSFHRPPCDQGGEGAGRVLVSADTQTMVRHVGTLGIQPYRRESPPSLRGGLCVVVL